MVRRVLNSVVSFVLAAECISPPLYDQYYSWYITNRQYHWQYSS